MGLASSLPVDFDGFAKYLEKERKRNWKQILCYAQNYAHVLTTGSAKDLLTLSSSRRKHAMEEPSSGPSRPVAELRKAQTIAAIRRMIVAGYSNSEMIEQLSISERTLYRRLAEAVDSDWQRLKEKDSSDELALQIGILEDRLNAAYRRLVAIATSPKTSARVKVEAE